jgi:hypothetical protein
MVPNTSTGRTSDIKCHRYQGFGHMQRDCPSKQAIIATTDGGYVSASDIEDENIIAANISGSDDGAEEVLGTSTTNNYRTLIVHRALSATVGEKMTNANVTTFSTCFLSSRTAVCIQSLTEIATTIW